MMEVDDEQEGNETMDVSNANFISSLSNPLRGYAEKCFPPLNNDAADDEKESIPTQQQQQQRRLDEFEISVRSHLLELIEQLLTAQDDGDDDDAALTTLLQYLKDVSLLCLHISMKTQSSSTSTSNNITAIKKLPFLLIEDTIDSLPLTLIQRVWSSPLHPSLCISSYINNNHQSTTSTTTTPLVLTSPQHLFIPTSKFVLLRICNKLLRLLPSSNKNNDDANFAGEIMLLLAQVFPLSERSAMNVLGGFNVGNVCRVEGLEEFEQRGDGGDNGGSSVGYEFYSKFWGVQKVFTDPAGTILTSSSTSARGGGSSSSDRVQAYESFIKDVTDILEAFESTPIVELQDKKNTDGNDKNQSQKEEQHPVQKHHKYLTNNQLLHLQLKDPTLRIHFLTQLLIILSYLSTLPPSLLPTGVQSTAGADTSKLMGQIRQTQLKELGLIEKRVQKLLLRATSAGSDVNNNSSSSGSSKNNGMWKALQWILRDRESMWKNWKKAKCLPAMDRVTTTTAGGAAAAGTTYTASGSNVQKLLLAGKKRKLDASSSNPSGGGARSSNDTLTIETLAQVTSEIKTSAQPTLTAFYDPYVEALDPENGIEGEYHPKNDKVYTWRGLRLMARDYQDEDGHLKRFGKLRRKDGDFEGIVRDIWKEKGEEIPGKVPEDYYQEDIVEEEEVSGGGATPGGKTDVDMDDVSVGSTQEAAIAKKEEEEAKKKRMTEFEKAAMEVEEDILDENEKATAAVDEGTKSNRSSYASLADAVVPNTKSEESAKEDKKKDEKTNEVKKDEKAESKKEEKTTEPKKEDGKDVKKEENGSKKGSPNSRSTKKGTPNSKSAPAKKDDGKNGGGKGKKEADSGKKDESKGSTKTNNSKGSDNNKNDSKQQTRSRAKFTPPQKVQQQQHQNKSEPQRDNSNSRGGGGGGGGGGRRGGNDRRGNNMPPPQPQPPQSRGGNRDGHGRAHTPPGGPSPRGGDQRGNNGPPRGGGGPGRGWEPPPGKFHPGQGGGGGRGGGGRPRRHGRR